jgi:hypothetical protein
MDYRKVSMQKKKTKSISEKPDPNISDIGNVSYPEMMAFFDSLGKVIDGRYRRLQIDFKSKDGKCFTATVYQCGATAVRRFVRIDLKKSDFKPDYFA